ncbi:MAG: type VI secretion system baseplate subunit TssE [Candidatus Acidiferrales bacterium]
MARTKSDILITQSLIDRLVQYRRDRSSETSSASQNIPVRYDAQPYEKWPETRPESVDKYRQSLKRDLEWLLNTRQPVMPELDSYSAVSASALNYGFPDIRSFDGSAGKERNALTSALEKCIRVFEPRIHEPQVYLVRSDHLNRSLMFHIEGQVSYEDMDEEVKFDTVLELISGEYEVK